MPLDKAMEESLRIAVEEAGQPRQVAQRLTAWLEALSGGGASQEHQVRFYENVRDALQSAENDDAG